MPKFEEVFGAVPERSPGEVSAFIDKARSGDEELKREVDSRLAAIEETNNFSSPGLDASPSATSETPQTVGPYRLIRELGVGGMGQVWLAEQEEPVRRLVALKLIRSGFFSPEITQRFLAERQSLALMNHPAIAKVFDAGTTSAGQPYLVMEYVDGSPITDYCDRVHLSIRDRLRLFQQVCEGVQHAHQKAIIHRDLKPSNILVTEVDGKPVARIIDFGVAKPVTQGHDGVTQFTQVGSMIGTLGYMSPEQADSGGEDIDTRSDVYSLGVVLYELLVGTLPLNVNRLTYSEILRVLRDVDAPRPSTGLRQTDDPVAIAAKRNTEVAMLERQLRGDADAIALKALEKDRNRRYATPADLAVDIGRLLQNEPVSARAPSTGYIVRKYFLRHKAGVLFASSAVLLMISFFAAQAFQLRNTQRQRDRADRIADFMIGIFKLPDPSRARGKTITAREILDNGAKQITTELKDDPELQASMLYNMANTYYTLGMFPQAHTLSEQSLNIQRRVLGTRNAETLRTMTLLGGLLADEGHYTEAEKLQRETLESKEKLLGPHNKDTLLAAWWLATTLSTEGKYPEAERLFRETLDLQRRFIGPLNSDTAMSTDGLANVLQQESHFTEAEKLYREAIAIDLRTLGADSPNTATSMSNLANTLLLEQRFADAEKEYRETLALQTRVIGPEHPDTVNTLANLGVALDYEGKHAEAEDIHRRAYEIDQRVLGPSHPETLRVRSYIGIELSEIGRYPEAEKLFTNIVQVAEKEVEPGVLANAWYNFACGAATAGHKEEALLYLARAVEKGLQGQDLQAEPYLESLRGDSRFQALRVRLGQANAS